MEPDSSNARSSSSADGNIAHVHAFAFRCGVRQKLPDFLGGEDEDRSDQAHERVGDSIDGGLRGAAAAIIGREGVEPILEHVEIKRAQVHDAEIVDRVIDAVKFERCRTIRGIRERARRCGEASRRPFPTDRHRQRVARGIEIEKIRKREAERVADFAIGLGELRHHRFGHAHVGRVILRCDPEAQQDRRPTSRRFRLG